MSIREFSAIRVAEEDKLTSCSSRVSSSCENGEYFFDRKKGEVESIYLPFEMIWCKAPIQEHPSIFYIECDETGTSWLACREIKDNEAWVIRARDKLAILDKHHSECYCSDAVDIREDEKLLLDLYPFYFRYKRTGERISRCSCGV